MEKKIAADPASYEGGAAFVEGRFVPVGYRAVARRAVAQDGKSMTITFDRKGDDRRIHNVAVYEKVAD